MQKISTDIIMIILALLACWISVAFLFSILTFFSFFVTGFALYELLFVLKIHLEALSRIFYSMFGLELCLCYTESH